MADTAAVEDQRVMEKGPAFLWEQGLEVPFHLIRVVVAAELQPAGEAADVGIDGDAGPAEGVAGHDVGRLAAHAWEGEQGVEVVGHVTAVTLNESLGGRNDVLGLGAKEPDFLDEWLYHSGRCFRQGLGIGIGLEERGRGGVDADVGRLSREDCGDQQLKRRAEVEFGGGIGITPGERNKYPPGSGMSSGVRLSRHSRSVVNCSWAGGRPRTRG